MNESDTDPFIKKQNGMLVKQEDDQDDMAEDTGKESPGQKGLPALPGVGKGKQNKGDAGSLVPLKTDLPAVGGEPPADGKGKNDGDDGGKELANADEKGVDSYKAIEEDVPTFYYRKQPKQLGAGDGEEPKQLPPGDDYIDADFRIVGDEDEPGPDPEQGKRYFSRLSTLRDIGVQALGDNAASLKALDKQYGALIDFAGAVMSGKPMSIASKSLATTMTGFAAMQDAVDDSAKRLGVRPGVDPMKLKDQLAVKGPAYYKDMDNAVAAERLVNSAYNDALTQAAKGKDLSQLTDAELLAVHDRMNAMLQPEYDRLRQKPRDQWNAEDKAYYNAYMAVEKGIGKRARALNAEMKGEMRAQKDQLKQHQSFLDANMGVWYRSGQMTDPKDVHKYMRSLEDKQFTGVQLTPDEQADLDDMRRNYGWQREIKSMQVDMTNDARLIPLWTQKAGTALSGALGGDDKVMELYEMAANGDLNGIRSILDTPAKVSAATGFAKLGMANHGDANLYQRNPMNDEDVMLAYALDAAISTKDPTFSNPIQTPWGNTMPKWMQDKQAAEARRAAAAAKAANAKRSTVNPGVSTQATGGAVKPVQTPQGPPAGTPSVNPPQNPAGQPAQTNAKPKNKTNSKAKAAKPAGQPAGQPVDPNSMDLQYTAEGGASDNLLNQQKQNLLRKLRSIPYDPKDDHYIKAFNRYQIAVAEHVLSTMLGNPKYTDEQVNHVKNFIKVAKRNRVPVMDINEFTGETSPKRQRNAWMNLIWPSDGNKNGAGSGDLRNPNAKLVQDPNAREELDKLHEEAAARIDENAPKLRELIKKSQFKDENVIADLKEKLGKVDRILNGEENPTDEEVIKLESALNKYDEELKQEASDIRKAMGVVFDDYDRVTGLSSNNNIVAKYPEVFKHLDMIGSALELLHPDESEQADEAENADEIADEGAQSQGQDEVRPSRWSRGLEHANQNKSVVYNFREKYKSKMGSAGRGQRNNKDDAGNDAGTPAPSPAVGAEQPEIAVEQPPAVEEQPEVVAESPDPAVQTPPEDDKKGLKTQKGTKTNGRKTGWTANAVKDPVKAYNESDVAKSWCSETRFNGAVLKKARDAVAKDRGKQEKKLESLKKELHDIIKNSGTSEDEFLAMKRSDTNKDNKFLNNYWNKFAVYSALYKALQEDKSSNPPDGVESEPDVQKGQKKVHEKVDGEAKIDPRFAPSEKSLKKISEEGYYKLAKDTVNRIIKERRTPEAELELCKAQIDDKTNELKDKNKAIERIQLKGESERTPQDNRDLQKLSADVRTLQESLYLLPIKYEILSSYIEYLNKNGSKKKVRGLSRKDQKLANILNPKEDSAQ